MPRYTTRFFKTDKFATVEYPTTHNNVSVIESFLCVTFYPALNSKMHSARPVLNVCVEALLQSQHLFNYVGDVFS